MRNHSDPTLIPDWAFEKARASLKIGLPVPEIEQSLVDKGLSHPTASTIVTNVLEDWVREKAKLHDAPFRNLRMQRVPSVVIGCTCIIVAYLFGTFRLAFGAFATMLLALPFIWFGDEFGSYRGWIIPSQPIPGGMVRLGGWF